MGSSLFSYELESLAYISKSSCNSPQAQGAGLAVASGDPNRPRRSVAEAGTRRPSRLGPAGRRRQPCDRDRPQLCPAARLGIL